MTAQEHYEAGRLNDAIAAMNEEVKRKPTDPALRGFLSELLCFAGDLERADRMLETAQHQSPETAVGISMFRQIIRAEQARRDFFESGRVPEVLGEPTPALQRLLEASIAVRDGDSTGALKLMEEAEGERPQIRGTCNGQAFEGCRDLDDLLAPVCEVLTSTGKYYLVPWEQIESMEFHPPEHPRDLAWRRVHMIVKGGPDGEVFIPALYPSTYLQDDERTKLGRATDWSGGEQELVRGLGQRILLFGEEDLPILSLKQVVIEHPDEE